MNNLKIGSFLQALRKTKGLTQADLADYFEISAKTVSKWECGDSLPEIPMLKALAEFYDVSVDEILNGEIGEKKAEKSKKDNEEYFYFKALKKLKLFSFLSYSILVLAFLLIFIITYTAARADIACWVSIAVTYSSGVFYAIAIMLTGQLDSGFDEKLICSYKTKRFWLIYSYVFATIYVTTCAIYTNARVGNLTIVAFFMIALPCIFLVAGVYPLFKLLLWKQIKKLFSNTKSKEVISIVCNVIVHLIYVVSIILLFACRHFCQIYYRGHKVWFYIWDKFTPLGWIGFGLVALSWISFMVLWLKKKNLFIPYLVFSLGFIMIIIEMGLYSIADNLHDVNMSLVFYYIFLCGFYTLLSILEVIKFFKKRRNNL